MADVVEVIAAGTDVAEVTGPDLERVVVEVDVVTESIAVVVEPQLERSVVEVDAPSEVQVVEVDVPGAAGPEGQRGPRGEDGGTVEAPAGETITRLQVVYLAEDGTFRPASSLNTVTARFVVGLAAHNAMAGETLRAVAAGPLPRGTSALPIGRLYLQEDGSVGPDWATGRVQLQVGVCLTAEVINVRLEPALYRGGTP